MHRFLIIALLTIAFGTSANSSEYIKKHFENPEVVGAGKLTYLLWDVYHATLYAPDGKWNRGKPFALSLQYLRPVSKKDIADRSVQEIRKLGYSNEVKLAAWYRQMKGIFPNVKKGTRLTGIFTPGAPTVFYNNNRKIGSIRDPEFGYWFFNIWLGKNTSEPGLRNRLTGQM